MKNWFLSFIFFLLLTGCSREESKPIRMGFNTWAGYEAVAITEEKGFFEQEGVDVNLTQFKALDDVKKAFAEGEIDVMLSTSNEVLLLASKGEKLKISLVADYSNGADAIVAQKGIKSFSDLKGKRIGVEFGSVSHYVLLKALEKAHLNANDVKLVNIHKQDGIAVFQSKTVDAVTTWSPYTDQLVKMGGHIVFTSKEIPGQIVDALSIRQDLIDKNPQACAKIIAAYFKTIDWFNKNRAEGIEISAKAANMTVSQFTQALDGVKITGFKDNMEAFGTPQTIGNLYFATEKFMRFLFNQKVIKKTLDVNKLIEPKFVREYAEQNKD